MATTNADNLAVEPPIYVENFSRTREHTYRALAADGLHRLPVHPTEEVWNQYQQIPLVPNPALVANAGPIGIVPVELIQMQLRPVAGSTLKWEQDVVQPLPLPAPPVGAPGSLVRVIPATFGNKDGVPGAYQPSLVGGPAYDGHTWVVDGLNRYVEFPYGFSTGATTLTLLFYRYTGLTGGGTIGPAGTHVWHYVADATAPNLTLCPDPAFPGAALSHFVAPLTAQSTEGAGSRIMFDVTKSAFRAGSIVGAQWDNANRGDHSFAYGQNSTAASAYSFVGGDSNTVGSFPIHATIVNGGNHSVTGNSGYGFIANGFQNTIVDSLFSGIFNGDRHTVGPFSDSSVILAGSQNSIVGTIGQPAIGNLIGTGFTNTVRFQKSLPVFSAIMGGERNDMQGQFSFIGTGTDNIVVYAESSFIGAGVLNQVVSNRSAIVAGGNNGIPQQGAGNSNFIGAGDSNLVGSTSFSGIVAGNANQITITTDPSTSVGNFIGAGTNNVIAENDGNVNRYYNFIGSGRDNAVTNSSVCAIVGGGSNTVNVPRGPGGPGSDRGYAFIGAGSGNTITQSSWSAIVAGSANQIVSASTLAEGYNFIGAGDRNSIFTPSTSTGSTNAIVSGTTNTIGSAVATDPAAIGCFIGSGQDNVITDGQDCVIGGGSQNRITTGAGPAASSQSVVGGGILNVVSGSLQAGIGGGQSNAVTTSSLSYVSGGVLNTITNANFAYIGGGSTNRVIDCQRGTIVCGDNNTVNTPNGTGNFIGAGSSNTINEVVTDVCTSNFIGSGTNNTISDSASSVLVGGQGNAVRGSTGSGATFNVLGGGQSNTINVLTDTAGATFGCTILCGGRQNIVEAAESFIGGGVVNVIHCQGPFINPTDTYECIRDVICGGSQNVIWNNTGSSIVGGSQNRISHDPSVGNRFNGHSSNFIGGGSQNVIDQIAQRSPSCVANAICGGAGNRILDAIVGGGVFALNNFIGGGRANSVGSKHSLVCGGEQNLADGTGCVVVGGSHQGDGGDPPGTFNNQATGDNSAVVCGHFNLSTGTYTFVGNGERNTASSTGSFVGSGVALAGIGNNVASGLNSAVVTGDRNRASGSGAFIGSGAQNAATGVNSVIPGGRGNNTTGAQTFAAGTTASAIHQGAFVWSDSTAATTSTGVDQFVAGCNGGVTFWSDTLRTIGVNLAPASVAWAAVCDQNMKENVLVLNPRDVLQRVDELPVYEFNYKGADAETRFRGPMAQDWHRLFPSKKDPLRIDTLDLDGIALAAIKGLSALVKEQSERIAALEARLGTL